MSTRQLFWIVAHCIRASAHRALAALMRNAAKMATAAPSVPIGANGSARCATSNSSCAAVTTTATPTA